MKKSSQIMMATVVGVVLSSLMNGVRAQELSSPDTQVQGRPDSGIVYKNMSYGPSPMNKFDLFIPAQVNKAHPQGLILCIHGGSWVGGSRSDMDSACKRYVNAGYLTATLDYSLLRWGHPEITIATMIDEIGLSLQQIKKTTSRLGYQVDKVALYGFSAGAHLSLLYAYSRANASPIPIAFVAAQSAPTGIDEDSDTGRMSDQDKQNWLGISPLAFITLGSVPSIIGSGAKDFLVPVDNGRKVDAKLTRCSVPHVYVEFPNSGHNLDNDPDRDAKFNEAVLQYIKKFLGPRSLRFDMRGVTTLEKSLFICGKWSRKDAFSLRREIVSPVFERESVNTRFGGALHITTLRSLA